MVVFIVDYRRIMSHFKLVISDLYIYSSNLHFVFLA